MIEQQQEPKKLKKLKRESLSSKESSKHSLSRSNLSKKNSESQSLNPENTSDINSPTEEVIDFSKKVEESRLALETEELKPVKRGPGRPRKSEVVTPQAEPQVAPQTEAVNPTTDISLILKGPVKLIGDIPSKKYKMPELALDDDEALQIAKGLNAVMNAWVPDVNNMSPKTASIIQLGLSISTVAILKYQIYQDKKAELNPVVVEPEVQEVIKKDQESGPSALDHFKR